MRNLDREMLHGNAETLVLTLLAEDECYGYQIRKDLAVRSHHYFQFAFGRLYPLLRGLEHRGLVKARWVKAGKVRQRRHYEITAKGLSELQERKRKWRQFSEAMELVLSSKRR
jgi:PadR family transcriptional regulator, regulatory protein PadR